MALGLLLILFMVMSIISVVGLLLLFLLKGERAQRIVFYFMALLGMFIGSGAALRQEQKCSTGGKAAGGGICGARHGGIIYRLKRLKFH